MSEDHQQVPNVFRNITSELETVVESLKSLSSLLECMKSVTPGIFDDDDFQIVQHKLVKCEQQKENLESDLAQKEEFYNTTIRAKEKILQQRETILESIDSKTGVFTHHPDIMQNFVKKQAELLNILQQMKNKLE